MKTIANIIRKDIYQNRRALLLWLALVLVHFGIRWLQLREPFTRNPTAWLYHFNSSRRVDLVALLILPVLLIPLIMHADPVQRPLAFWRSLPVSRGRLIAAKALLVGGVFVVLPLLVEIAYFLLAGMAPVLGASLGLWTRLHLPVVAMVFVLCYVTPGWKSYLCLVVPFLGFGLPVPRMTDLLHHTGTGAEPAVAGEIEELPPGKLPADASWQIEPGSGRLAASVTTYAPQALNKPTEVVGGSFMLSIDGLPPDLVGETVGCDGAELWLDNGGRVRVARANLAVSFANGRLMSGDMVNSNRNCAGLPKGECFSVVDPLGPIPAGNNHRVRVIWEQVPCDFASLPATGGVLKGVLRLTLARKHPVREWPLEDGLKWQDRLRTMEVRLLEQEQNPQSGVGEFNFELGFRRPVTVLSAAATELDHRRFPGYFLWLEHRTHPLRKALLPLAAGRDWSPDAITDLSRNQVFERSRQNFTYYMLVNGSWQQEHGLGQFPLRKFTKEENSWEHWRLSLTAYEPAYRVTLPFEVRLAKPYRPNENQYGRNHPRNFAPEPAVFAAALAAIQVPEKPSVQAADEAFFQLSALAGPSAGSAWQGTPQDRVIDAYDVAIDGLLRQVYQASPRALIEGSRLAAVDFTRENERTEVWDYGWDGRQSDMVAEVFNGRLWGLQVRKLPAYWLKVNKVVETQSTPADKDLILANLHPGLDQVPTLERHGWIDEALPVMSRIARRQRVSESWFRVLLQHPSPQTQEALLAQVRMRSLSFGRMMELFARDLPAADHRRTAEIIWQIAVRSARRVGDLCGAFAVALQHGVASAPSDLKSIIQLGFEESAEDSDEREVTQKSYLSLIQAMALWSDCPEAVEAGCGWILDHGGELKWDPVTRRYVIPGAAPGPHADGTGVDVSDWGTLVDPLGVARLWRNERGLTIRSSALPTDFYEGVTHNFSPRILREVTGDFTAEVTVQPQFAGSASWTRDLDDQFQSGGLVVVASQWDWLRLDNLAHAPEQYRKVGESLIKGLNPTFADAAPPAFDPNQPVSLQIRRHGDFFVSAWRQGGGEWREFTGHRIHQWPKTVKVGVLTINKNTRPFEAVFSGFSITPTAAPPMRLDAPDQITPPEQTTRDGDDLGLFGKAANISGAGVFQLQDRRLTIITRPQTSDFNPTHFDNAPRAVQVVTGDFSFEVTIAPASTGKGWVCPNLMFADAGKRIYFRVGPIHDGNQARFNAFLKVDTQYAYLPPMLGDSACGKPMRVRVRRSGQVFAVGLRPQDGEWIEFPPFLVPGCPATLQVGVLSLNAADQVAVGSFADPQLWLPPPPAAEQPGK